MQGSVNFIAPVVDPSGRDAREPKDETRENFEGRIYIHCYEQHLFLK